VSSIISASFRTFLNVGQFGSYQQLQNSGGSLGLNVPVVGKMLGLSADAQTNSGTFSSAMSQFLSSNYDQWAGATDSALRDPRLIRNC
jgi:hypothetical protein